MQRLEIQTWKWYEGSVLKWGRGIRTWRTLEKGRMEWWCKCNRTVSVIIMSIVSNLIGVM